MYYSTSEEQDISLRERILRLCVPKEPLETALKPKLKELKGIKGVYFDVYGTILISGTEPMMRADQNREFLHLSNTFESFGIDAKKEIVEFAIERLHRHVQESHARKKARGIDFPEVDIISVWKSVIRDLKSKGEFSSIDEKQVPELLTDYVTRYDEPWLMPGLTTTLDQLRFTDKDIGIISNSQFYTPLTLEALTDKPITELGFEKEKCFWSYAEDVAKPSVEFYKRAVSYLKTIGIKSEEILFVGNDMLNDIYPAQKTGFKTALFAGDKRSLRLRESDERCKGLEPDIVITELTQITECI